MLFLTIDKIQLVCHKDSIPKETHKGIDVPIIPLCN